jgi:hypothetical protein
MRNANLFKLALLLFGLTLLCGVVISASHGAELTQGQRNAALAQWAKIHAQPQPAPATFAIPATILPVEPRPDYPNPIAPIVPFSAGGGAVPYPPAFDPLTWDGERWWSADGKWSALPHGKWASNDGNLLGVVAVKPKAVRRPSYPTRSVTGSRWRYNGGQITAAHLADDHGHHSHEHFDYSWLKTLSNAQLTALGSDAHDGNVREQYVVRSTAGHHAAPARRVVTSVPTSSCPNGNCPNTSNTMRSRGLFGGLLRR